jgi:CheY-like chemotaxis protein
LLTDGSRFDVVFCDLMMPHLTGMDLFARIMAQDPALAERFVFMTGGISNETLLSFLAEVPNERLDKPLSSQNLRGVARRFAAARD